MNRNLGLLWVGQFVNTAGLMMLVPIMPFYVQELGVRGAAGVQTWAGIAIAAPALALTVATPLWGRLGDRIGRHWMVVRSLVGLAAAMVVMATAMNPMVLVLGRLLQGGLGGVVEAAQAFAGSAGPAKKRGSSLGKSFSATAAGSLSGPLLGGLMVGAGRLSDLMLVIAVLAVLLALACAFGLREEPAERAVVDRGGARTAATARRFRHLPGALPLAAAAVTSYLGVYGLIPVFAAHVQQGYPAGHAELWVGVFQSVTWGATLIASFWWGAHNDRARRPVRALAWTSAGCAVAITAQALPLGTAILIGLRLLQGACFAALAQSLFFHVSRWAPADRRSGLVGKANSFLLAGQSIGPLLAGPMALVFPPSVSILLLGTSCAVAALCCARAASAEASGDSDEKSGSVRTMSGVLDPPSEQTHPIPAVPAGAAVGSPRSSYDGQHR